MSEIPANDRSMADDAHSVVVVCQGPPLCDREGDEAVRAQMAGCPWCERITLFDDGTETKTGPYST